MRCTRREERKMDTRCGYGHHGIERYHGDDPFDRTIEWLVAGLLLFMPLAFGAVEAWSEEIVLLLAAAISVCLLLKVGLSENGRWVWTWAYVPIAILLVAIIVQLIPLPSFVVRLVSPHTVARKLELLQDLPAGGEGLSTISISFYPNATRHDLRLVLAVATVFVAVLNVYRRPDQIIRLLTVVVAVGAFCALLTIAQNTFGNNRIYWFVPTPASSNAHSGPFVNHSHYAQFMNLSVGAAVALLFVKLRIGFRMRPTVEGIAEYLGSPDARIIWVLMGVILLGMSTIFVSLSRGGVISLLIAGAFTSLIVSLRLSLKGPGWIVVLLTLGAFACVLYVGFDAVYDRLATLGDFSSLTSDRWQIVKDIAVAWTKFPILGTGLGTHEVVYPEFDRSTIPSLAAHAENEYAQLAEEMGIVGLLALGVFGVLVWVRYARAIKNRDTDICAVAYGLGFGLLAILVHSLSDFGQHVPANATLSAIFCALLIRVAAMGEGQAESSPVPDRGWRRGWMVGLAVLALVWGWALFDVNGARVSEAHWNKALAAERDFVARGWQGTDEEYTYLLGHAQQAAQHQPGNVKYQHWLNVYRWHAISRTTDPNTGEILLTPEAMEFAGEIVDEFNRARLLCPTFGPVWCVQGQLERAVLGLTEQGARHVREGVKLSPCHPTARLVAGIMEAEEGNLDVAHRHFEMVVALDGRLFGEVAQQLAVRFGRADLAVDLAGENIDHLSAMVEVLEAVNGETELLADVREKVIMLLHQRCQEPDTPAVALVSLAEMYRSVGRATEAIESYRRALALDYGEVNWRLSLARLLAEVGELEEAVRETQTCLRFRPGYGPAVDLLDMLSPRLVEQRSQLP